jgi:hypothetical protein
MTERDLSDRELATVLAALRHWQRQRERTPGALPGGPHHFEDVTPLSAQEIDELCERLNCPARSGATSTAP